MSVFFKDISPDNPVRDGDAERLIEHLGLTIKPEESQDYQRLLAAVHDCAERVAGLPDYQTIPDFEKYPRENVRLPTSDEQAFGHAWAHRFLIRGDAAGSVLKGKTVCLKDCIAVATVPQFFGSDAFRAWVPETDATVVTRVLDHGADVLGTATCEHFCNSTSSFTSAQGTVENPHREGYSAGGSTSGGAALVSAGLVDIALGTDQGGSIRVPASLSGCVGLKPTHGLVPYTGITSGDPIDDHAGPLAASVGDIALCLDAVAGHDNIDDRSASAGQHGSFHFAQALRTPARLDGVRIGILKEGFGQHAQQAVSEQVVAAAQKFRDLGAVVEEVSVPLHLEGPSIWTIQQRMSGAAGILGRAYGRRGLQLTEFETARLPWTDANFQKLFPSTKNTVINGLYLMDKFPGLYSKTVNIGRQIRDAYDEALKNFDVLIMPTTPFVAPRHGPRDSVLGSFEPSIGLTSNTAVFNVTGHPAMSIPVGFAPAADDANVRLPVGMQVVGGMWQEHKILRVGQAWEANFDWKKSGDGALSLREGFIGEQVIAKDELAQPATLGRETGPETGDFPGVALVTGAGGTGIGAAVAKAFARRGCARIAITDINASSLAMTRDAILGIHPSAQVFSQDGDVSQIDFVDAFVKQVSTTLGRVDYAVNCAGVLGPALRSHETPLADFERINNINYKGVWLSSRAQLAQMLQQDNLPQHPDQKGSIVNIASQLGIVARPEAGAYCASKAAVINMTKSDAIDYSKDGIRVNAVCPGLVETPMTRGSEEATKRLEPAIKIAPMERMGKPDEIAETVLFLCSSRASFVQGHALVVDGGYTIN